MIRRPPRSTLFPYTPLSRSHPVRGRLPVPLGAQPPRRRLPRARRGVLPRRLPGGLRGGGEPEERGAAAGDRKSTRLNSSHANISYAVFCLKKKRTNALYTPT